MRNLHFKRWLTIREWRRYAADDWRGYDAEMRRRLTKLPTEKQLKLLIVSKYLAHRCWYREELGLEGALLDKLAGEL